MSPLQRAGLVLLVVALLLQMIRQVFFSAPALQITPGAFVPTSDARSKQSLSHTPSIRQKHLSFPVAPDPMLSRGWPLGEQRQFEPGAKRSAQSTAARQPDSNFTEQQTIQLEQQRLLEEQANQEAADYERSLQSTGEPRADSNLTEQERIQLEQQRLFDEQAKQEAADYERSLQSASAPPADSNWSEQERVQFEQQRLFDEEAKQEAADYERSLQSVSESGANADPSGWDNKPRPSFDYTTPLD